MKTSIMRIDNLAKTAGAARKKGRNGRKNQNFTAQTEANSLPYRGYSLSGASNRIGGSVMGCMPIDEGAEGASLPQTPQPPHELHGASIARTLEGQDRRKAKYASINAQAGGGKLYP